MLKFLRIIVVLLPFLASAKASSNNIIVSSPQEKYFGDEDVRPSLYKLYAKEIREIETYLNSFKTFVTQFKQSNTKGEISHGKIFVAKPGKIRCEYFNPSPILLIMKDKKVIYYDKDLDEVSYASSDINALKLLALSDIKFNEFNLVEIEKNSHFLTLSLKEYSEELKQNLILTLKFSYPKLQLKQMSVITEDNEIDMIFDKITYNQILGKQLFYFHRDALRNKK